MAGFLRRAGHGRTPNGATVTWSVAEGRKGRRWREVQVGAAGEGSGIVSSLLLELGPDGRFAHLELSTAAGLLTLHPEGDGTLHGNDVGRGGVGHVVGLPWDRDDIVLVETSIVCLVAAAAPTGRAAARSTGALHVGLDLGHARTAVEIGTPGPGRWRLEPGGEVEIDADGLPVLGGGMSWELDRDA